MKKIIFTILTGKFLILFLRSIAFRLSDKLIEKLSFHSLQHTTLNTVTFQSYDLFEKFMEGMIFPDHQNIKLYLKPFFVNLVSVYFRLQKSPIDLHNELVILYLGPTSVISKKHSIVTSREKTKKKILFATSMFPSVLHGGGLRIFDIIDNLYKEYDIYLFSTFVPEVDSLSFEYLKSKVREYHLMSVSEFSVQTFDKWISKRASEETKFDVIHLEYHESLQLYESARKIGKKVIFTYMECLSLSYYLKFVSSPDFKKKYFADDLERFIHFALLEKYAMDHCDEVIAVTDHDADFIAKFSSHRPKVINHCVSDFSVWNRLEQAEYTPIENSVCFVANFQHPPNIDGMLWYIQQVHKEIKKKIPDYKVIIVGSGNTEQLKKVTGNDETFIYTGYVDDIVPSILSSTICISPLISGAGLRGKVNQYSACGKASVNTSISLRGLPFTPMKDTVLADEPIDFANAVIKLLTDKNFRSKIEKNSLAVVKKHFSWESKIKELVQLY